MIKSNKTARNLSNQEYSALTKDSLVLSNNQQVSLKIIEENDSFMINSTDYIILDSDALELIKPLVSYSDFGALLYISRIVSSYYNICMKTKEAPHTTETIAIDLKITRQGAHKILSKLVKHNILAYAICYPAGFKQKLYIINPSLLRKGKKYSNDIKPLFKDLTKENKK